MHLAESGEDGSTTVDDIMLLKFLHVNRKALITVLKGIFVHILLLVHIE